MSNREIAWAATVIIFVLLLGASVSVGDDQIRIIKHLEQHFMERCTATAKYMDCQRLWTEEQKP